MQPVQQPADLSNGPLAGIRILDLSQGVSGPYATKLFSDYGADVLKVERPGSGDPSRRIGPFPDDDPHPDRSGMFIELNSGKRSVTLDLGSPSGLDLAKRLAADVDLIVESYRPGTLERLGLGPEVLAEINPRASLVRISNFGQSGPYRDYDADDLLAYAMGGVLSITVNATQEPVKIGQYAPLFLAGGAVAAFAFGAFNAQRRSGVGERVDASLFEILASSMDRGATNLLSYEYSGSLFFQRTEDARTTAVPYGVFPCADGYIHILCQPRWWDRFCRMIEREDLIEDPAYTERLFELDFAPEIDGFFYPWLLERTKQQVMEAGQAVGVPISAINTVADVAADPHLRAREFFTPVDQPAIGPLPVPGLPFRMLGTPGRVRPAPTLGQHNREVLTGLGYTPEEVVLLRQRGVI